MLFKDTSLFKRFLKLFQIKWQLKQATVVDVDLGKAEIIPVKLKRMTSHAEWLLGSNVSVRVTLTLSSCYRSSSRVICCLRDYKGMKNSDVLYTGKSQLFDDQ